MALSFEELKRRELAKSGNYDPDDEPEQEEGEPGVDFFTDKHGRIWSGGVCIGGDTDVELDVKDAMDEEALRQRLDYSPAQLQRLHAIERERWEAEEGEPEPDPPEPLMSKCEGCGREADLRTVHPLGGVIRTEQGNACALHTCRCGEEVLVDARAIHEAGGADYLAKADEEHAILQEIQTKYVPKFSWD